MLNNQVTIGADTSQAVTAVNKLNESLETTRKTVGGDWMASFKGNALVAGFGALKDSVMAYASSVIEAAKASAQLWQGLQSQGGAAAVELAQRTGFLMDNQELIRVSNKLLMGDMRLSTDQMVVLIQTASALSKQFGEDKNEILGKITDAIASGKRLDTFLAKHGIEVKLTGDKAKDAAIAIDALAQRFGGVEMKAKTALSQMSAYNNQMELIKATASQQNAMLGPAATLAQNWRAITDGISMILQTGRTVDSWAQQVLDDQQLKLAQQWVADVDKMGLALDSYVDSLAEANRTGIQWRGTMQDVEDLHQNVIDGTHNLKIKFAEFLDINKSDALQMSVEQLNEMRQKMTDMYQATGRLNLARSSQNGALLVLLARLKAAEVFEASAARRAREWADALEKARGGMASIADAADRITGGFLSGLARNFGGAAERFTSLMESKQADKDTKGEGYAKAIQDAKDKIEIARRSADIIAEETAQKQLQINQYVLQIYRTQGEARAEVEKKLGEVAMKRMEDLRKAALEAQYAVLNGTTTEIEKQTALNALLGEETQNRLRGIQLQGMQSIRMEAITEEIQRLDFAAKRNQYDIEGNALIAQKIALLQQEAAGIAASVQWSRALVQADKERAVLLPYMQQGKEGMVDSVDLKAKEAEYQQALIAGDAARATALQAEIIPLQQQANEYGKLQAKLASYGAGWQATKQLTESVFRGTAEAMMMSNAELAKAGKTRAQVIMEQLKVTLRSLAVENAVKGGTRLAEAIAASVIPGMQASAGGLYASAGKHFLVAALAGGASGMVGKLAGGGSKAAAAAEKTSPSTTTTTSTANTNYIYNISDSMMLSNPDDLVRKFNTMERSYTERRA